MQSQIALLIDSLLLGTTVQQFLDWMTVPHTKVLERRQRSCFAYKEAMRCGAGSHPSTGLMPGSCSSDPNDRTNGRHFAKQQKWQHHGSVEPSQMLIALNALVSFAAWGLLYIAASFSYTSIR